MKSASFTALCRACLFDCQHQCDTYADSVAQVPFAGRGSQARSWMDRHILTIRVALARLEKETTCTRTFASRKEQFVSNILNKERAKSTKALKCMQRNVFSCLKFFLSCLFCLLPPDAGESQCCSLYVVRVAVSRSVDLFVRQPQVEPEGVEVLGTRDQLLGQAL